MEKLGPLRVTSEPPASRARAQRPRHVVEVRDPKTAQTLRVLSDEPLQVFVLDPEGGKTQPEGVKTPDAVIVGETASGGFVIFVDLTQSMRPRTKKKSAVPVDPTPRKLEQLLAGITHFHPALRSGRARTHGDEHHDAWSAGDDLPAVRIKAEHRVGGLGIGFHHGARTLPVKDRFGTKDVVRAIWSPVPSTRNVAEVTLGELFKSLGWRR